VRAIIGVLIIILGIAGGIYLGAWLCFVGGIIQVIEAVKATPIISSGIAIGLLRIVSASLVGWVTFLFCSVVGAFFITSN
jgi:hypothetical protein